MSQALIYLDSRITDKIVHLGLLRYPAEACGLLFPVPRTVSAGPESQVVELPNRSLTPHDEYVLKRDDLLQTFIEWAHRLSDEEKRSVVVWHTHPQGGVGPSHADIEKKVNPTAIYLVVALDYEKKTGTACWF